MKRIFLIQLFISLMYFSIIQSQNDYKFIHFGINEGIEKEVHFIKKDSFGYIWIGTQSGLLRYDGYDFVSLPIEGAERLNAKDIVFLDEENYWIVANWRIIRYNPITESAIYYTSDNNDTTAIIGDNIECVFFTSNGKLLFGHNKGISEYDFDKDNFSNYRINKAKRNDARILCMDESKNGNIYAGSYGGSIYEYSSDLKLTKDFGNFGYNRITKIQCMNEDSIYFTAWSRGLCLLNKETDSVELVTFGWGNEINDYFSNRVRDFQYSQNKFFLASNFGLVIYTPKDKSYEIIQNNDRYKKSLSNNRVSEVYIDEQDGIWAGTSDAGLNYTHKTINRFKNYSRYIQFDSKLLSNEINSVIEISPEEAWILTNKGIAIFNPEKNKFVDVDDTERIVSNINIPSGGFVYNDTVFIGNNRTVFIYNLKNNTFSRIEIDTDETIDFHGMFDLTMMRNSKELLFNFNNTTGIHVLTTDLNTGKVKKIFDKNSRGRFKLNNRHYLITTSETFNIYDFHTNEIIVSNYFPDEQKAKLGNLINTPMMQLSDSTIGLFSNKTFFDFNVYTGEILGIDSHALNLPDYKIYSAISQQEYNYWLLTNIGLLKYDWLTDEAHVYTNEDGLFEQYKQYDDAFGLSSGQIIITSNDGMTFFDPQAFNIDGQELPLRYTSLKINDELVQYDPEGILNESLNEITYIELSHKQNNLEFEFSLLNYILTSKNKYQYIINGLMDKWSEPQHENKIVVQNLPSGKYTLEIKAANHDDMWLAQTQPIIIRVLPPFYFTWWFITLSIAIIVFIIILLIRMRERQMRKEKLKLEKIINESKQDVEKQKKAVEDQRLMVQQKEREQRYDKWFNEGMVRLSNVMSDNRDNLKLLCKHVLIELIDYIVADQGAIFLLDDAEPPVLKQMYAYAYNKERLDKKEFMIGEGEVGVCFKDGEMIIIDDVPPSYSKIESGLGFKPPKNILISPIILDDLKVGVLEVASFKVFKDHHKKLISQLCRALTSYLHSLQSKERMEEIVKDANVKSEELKSQEEQLRQNLEEMKATQEESDRREKQLEKQNRLFEKKEMKLERIMHDIESSNQEAKAKKEKLESENKELHQKIKTLNTELEKLKEEK